MPVQNARGHYCGGKRGRPAGRLEQCYARADKTATKRLSALKMPGFTPSLGNVPSCRRAEGCLRTQQIGANAGHLTGEHTHTDGCYRAAQKRLATT